MDIDYQTQEAGRMWRDLAQSIYRHLDGMVAANQISKGVALASEVGMSDNEWYNRIALNPRTPLTRGETVAILHQIKKHSPLAYQNFLREFFCDNINVF